MCQIGSSPVLRFQGRAIPTHEVRNPSVPCLRSTLDGFKTGVLKVIAGFEHTVPHTAEHRQRLFEDRILVP